MVGGPNSTNFVSIQVNVADHFGSQQHPQKQGRHHRRARIIPAPTSDKRESKKRSAQ